jgi:DNA-binding MarR family transcriptional regulator
MQQLQNASEARPEACARAVLEAVLEVMVTVREKTARRHGGEYRGPTLVHFRALGVLRKRPGATLSMLSDQLALTLSATSRLVDCLVARRLVERTVPAGNRRTVSLVLTAAGERLLEKAMRDTQRELAMPLRKLSPRERAALCAAMGTLRQVMEAEAPEKIGNARRF